MASHNESSPLTTPPKADIPVDGIALDACRGCGHSIRGLSTTSSCPECGTRVRDSSASLALSAADPEWLRRINRGLGLGSVMNLVLPLFALRALRADGGLPIGTDWSRIPIALALAATFPLCIRNALDLTARDPRETDREPLLSPRSVFQVAFGLSLGLQVAAVAASYADPTTIAARADEPIFRTVAMLLLVVAILACFRRLRWLALRVPDVDAAHRMRLAARWVGWSWSLLISFYMLPQLVMLTTPLRLATRSLTALSAIAVVISLFRIGAATRAFTAAMQPLMRSPAAKHS
jgi:hypothetical protein